MFPNMWRIPQAVIHQRSVNPEKSFELPILRKGPSEFGNLAMNCIDVRGWIFDNNIDDEQPKGLLRTSLQAVNKLDRNQNIKLSLGASKVEWFSERKGRQVEWFSERKGRQEKGFAFGTIRS